MKRGLPPAFPSRNVGHRGHRDYSPLSWNNYFDDMKDVEVNGDIFRVYICGDNAEQINQPLLLLLHGGGYSALTWALFAVR